MSDTFDKLNNTFNIEVDNTGEMPNKLSKVTNEPPTGETDVHDDYQYSRAQLYSLIEKGQEAIQGALDVAQNTDHPRACLLYTSDAADE